MHHYFGTKDALFLAAVQAPADPEEFLPEVLAAPPEEDLMAAVGRWVPMFTGTALRWDRLDLIREHWDGPIALKGVQHVDDALRAADAGVDAVVVSNHGGRQVDRAVGSLDALPGVVMIGDRIHDVEGARRFSVPAILVGWASAR